MFTCAPALINDSGGTPPPFSPSDLSGLVTWLDLSNPLFVTTLAGDVVALIDRSGNGNNAAQASSGNRFQLAAGAIDGLDAMQSNGSNTSFMNFTPFSTTGALSIFCVAYPIVGHNSPNAIGPSAGGAGGLGWGSLTSARNFVAELTATKSVVVGGIPVVTKQQVLGMTYDGSTLLTGYYNGSVIGSASAGTAPSGLVFDQIGYGGAGSFSFTGYWCEAVLYSRVLTAPEIAQLSAYFIAKWDTP